MSQYANLSEFINRKTGGNDGRPETFTLHKPWRVNGAANTQPTTGKTYSWWPLDGYPGAGSGPGATPHIPTQLTPGAVPFAAPTGGREKWLDYAHAINTVTGGIFIVDRIWAVSGFSKTITTVQSIPSVPLTRYTSGVDNLMFLEIYSIIGSTVNTLTVTYTNELGVGGRVTTVPIGTNGYREAGVFARIPFAGDDEGVRSIESVQLSGSVGGTGDFGVTIARRVTSLLGSVANVVGSSRSFIDGHPIKIADDACLTAVWVAGINTSPGSMVAQLSFTER